MFFPTPPPPSANLFLHSKGSRNFVFALGLCAKLLHGEKIRDVRHDRTECDFVCYKIRKKTYKCKIKRHCLCLEKIKYIIEIEFAKSKLPFVLT